MAATSKPATDKRPVSLTKRQWHLICLEWNHRFYVRYADVMEKAVPVILAKCEEVKSPDDIVTVSGSVSGWETVANFCGESEVLRWNVQGDIEKQIGA
jgi:hypothetical protein